MRKNGKKLAMAVAACALVGAMSLAGTMAYLSDSEGATNTFTVGKVQVDLTEPNYPGNDSESTKNLVPNQEISKDPKVTNTGTNDAIVFATVEVPVKNVTVVAADGTKGEKGATELFWFKQGSDAKGSFANNFNSTDWLQLTAKETHGEADGDTTTYVFAYKTAVSKDAQTETLFDKVQLKNIMENEVAAGAAQDIKVKTYAIQASEVLEGDTDLTDAMDAASLGKIYDIYLGQAGGDAKDADTSNKLKLDGSEL